MRDFLEIKVKRGRENWSFIYTIFAILLAVVIFVVSVLEIGRVAKIIVGFFVVIFVTYLCLWNATFQNKLIGLKIRLEENWKRLL